MSFYFKSTTRLLAAKHQNNLHQQQSRGLWSIKWALRRNVINKNSNGSQLVPLTVKSFSAGGTQDSGQNSSGRKKGKFNKLSLFHVKWSWKAGASWTILSVLDWWLLAAGGWFTWSALFARWAPIGMCVLAALEWHVHRRKLEEQGLPKVASKFQTNIYCSLPLRLVSRAWGWIADCSVPTNLRPFVYGLYSNAFSVNLDEAAISDMKEYRSISEFFTRPLKEGVRQIDNRSCLISPADGKVLHYGTTNNQYIEQVKGITYSIESFLGSDSWTKNLKSQENTDTCLYQCVIYLGPGDYHRFHSPTNWEANVRRHFVGELLSVSPKIAEWLPGLFCLNERALYIGKWEYGFFSFTAVGATNVGSVQIYFDEMLKTNRWLGVKLGMLENRNNNFDEITLSPEVKLTKGQLIGQFNMGSTIVLIFEAPKNFRFVITPGQKIRMGEPLGCVSDCDNDLNKK